MGVSYPTSSESTLVIGAETFLKTLLSTSIWAPMREFIADITLK